MKKRALSAIKTRSRAKAVSSSANLYYVLFFVPLNESETSEQASRQVATEEPRKGCQFSKHRNLHSCNMSRNENSQREKEMDSLSFEGFRAQFDRKRLMYGIKIKHS